MGTPTMYVDLVRAVQEAGAQDEIQADVAMIAGAPITPQLAMRMSTTLGLQRICVSAASPAEPSRLLRGRGEEGKAREGG